MEVAEPRARQPPTLPMDLLLEIIARSDDVTTVVRCAAGCKPLRRAVLDPDRGFLDRLRRRAEANGGFDPSLLMAVSYRLPASLYAGTGTGSIVVQPPGRLRLDTDLLPLGSSITASSRDGLLVVQRDGRLLVCNTITGNVTSLPTTGLMGTGALREIEMFQPALLSVDGAGRSFQLLVMYEHEECYPNQWRAWSLRTQIISSKEEEWGAAREVHINNLPEGVRCLTEASSSAPAIEGHSVHWLCYTHHNSSKLTILALNAESAHASVIKLPQELLTRMGLPPSAMITRHGEKVILVTTAIAEREKRLSLVVAEPLVISTWTLVPDAEEGSSNSWSRQVVIRRREIGSPLTTALHAYQPIRLNMFGERSGTVLFWMQSLGLVQLNLATKKALVLWRDSHFVRDSRAQAFLHEINLISVLECWCWWQERPRECGCRWDREDAKSLISPTFCHCYIRL